MKLDSVSLTNFRCFPDEKITFSPYTAILGPNNSGKSTILKAIDLFFRTTQKSSPLTVSDFNDPRKELRIALSFSDIPEKAQAVSEFGHYFRHGKLEFFIKAHVNEGGHVTASVHGQRLGLKAFTRFHKLSGANEKKTFYNELRTVFPDLPELAQSARLELFESALIECEARHQDKQETIESEDLAFGASGVAARLKRYVDWVYIPAVKDAAEEDEEAKNTAFGVLVNRIIRSRVKVEEKLAGIQAAAHDQVKALVGDYKEEVKRLENVLDQEFRKITSTNAHVHLDWTELGSDSVSINLPLVRSVLSDDTFRGEVSRFGHGLQRNYLMTLVHLNAKFALEDQPSIILACEEPELYQHPPQAKYLHLELLKIAEGDQVLITTHSPYFISARTFENVRVVRKTREKASKVSFWTIDEHRSLIAKARGEEAIGAQATLAKVDVFIQPELSETFFCGKQILVEGIEDRAVLIAALLQAKLYDEFTKCGCHIIGVNGKGGLINTIAMARGFGAPYFVMFDADTNCKPSQIERNKKENATIVSLLGLADDAISWPSEDIFRERAIIWKNNFQDAISHNYPNWYPDVREVCAEWGWDYDRLAKNPAVISHALEAALGKGLRIECIEQAVDRLMAFARD